MNSITRARYSLRTLLLAILVASVGVFLGTRRMLRPDERSSSTSEGMGLQTVIEGLRNDLEATELRRLADSKAALFEVKDVDVELQVIAKSSYKDHAKIEFQVVTAEMEHEIAAEATHKVVLHMQLAPQTILRSSRVNPALTSEGAVQIP